MASTTPAADIPPPRISPWSVFRHPTFRIIWVATIVSNVGGWVSSTASGWLMTSLKPEPLAVSLVQVMSNLPMFLLALPAGALVDMVDQRRLLIVAELAIMASTVAFAILVWTHLITPTSLLIMTALSSAAGAVSLPAWQTVVSQLVPKPELPAAVALNSVGVNISRALGPAIGGFLVTAFGFGPPFWVDAFSNAGVIAGLFRWRRPARSAATLPRERIGSALRVGLRHARYNPHLSATLIRTAAFFLTASAYWALLPVATLRQASGGATLYGGLLGMIGAGAVLGAFLLPRLKERLGADRLMAGCAAGTALAMALFGVARNPGTFVLASALAGACWIGAVSSLNISAQVALPEWVRGRGLAIFVTVMFGALTLGGLLWGKVAAVGGTSRALLAAAALAALMIPLTWKWKLQTGADVDFTPQQWPAPITTHKIEGDRGPVMVTVEYRVAAENRARFLKAIYRYSRSRRRDGAYDWRLFEDPAEDGKFVETFMTDSWLEHLRLHARVTKADRLQEAIVQRLLIGNSYKTTHLIEVDGE